MITTSFTVGNLKIWHCLIDQANARLKSGSCLIYQAGAWLKSGPVWLIRQLPDQHQAAAWLIRRLPDWNHALPDWSGGCQIKIMQLPDQSWLRFLRSLYCNVLHCTLLWLYFGLPHSTVLYFRPGKSQGLLYKHFWQTRCSRGCPTNSLVTHWFSDSSFS